MSFLVPVKQIDSEKSKLVAKFCKYKIKEGTKIKIVFWNTRLQNESISLPLGCASIVGPKQEIETFPYSNQVALREEQVLFCRQNFSNSIPFSQAWSLRPGFGKTMCAIAAIFYYNLPTCIIVHRTSLKNQWLSILSKYKFNTMVQVQMISTTPLDSPMIIVDEAHACFTSNFVKRMVNATPRILIGMSGTFYRNDAQQAYLHWIFGPPITLCQEAQFILDATCSRQVFVKIVNTNIEPIVEYSYQQLDWTKLLSSLAFSETRNDLICKCVAENRDKHILILTKFVKHAEILQNMISNSSLYVGNDQVIDTNAKVLISTIGKIGTGVSIDTLNCLIVAIDVVNYSIQYISRILRSKTQDAYIFDFVDNHPSLQRHFLARRRVYKQLNAQFIF